MHLHIILLAVLPFTYGQYGAPPAVSSTTAPASTSSAASSTPSNVQIVNAGANGLAFSPNSITAAVGTMVEFHFFPPAHSVAQSPFSTPCAPPANSSGFWSGILQQSGGQNTNVFRITINDTNPIWFYCAVPTHCQSGMVGVINPPNDQTLTLANYQTAAGKTGSSIVPGSVGGGVIGAAASATSSGAAATTSAKPSGAGNIWGQMIWIGVAAPFIGWGIAVLMA